MRSWRFLNSGKNDPFLNMAIDEAILRNFSAGKTLPTLRIYGWVSPAFSLGYSQDASRVLNLNRTQGSGFAVVRRITGGETLYHHPQEISYSLVCSQDDVGLGLDVKQSFKVLTRFLLKTYEKLGLNAAYFSDLPDGFSPGESVYCFAKKQDFDIAVNQRKLGGNAQKRMRNIIFQHGSIPLSRDIDRISGFLKEDLAGLRDNFTSLSELLSQEISEEELTALLSESFAENFSAALIADDLSLEEQNIARNLAENKYRDLDWNHKFSGSGQGICR